MTEKVYESFFHIIDPLWDIIYEDIDIKMLSYQYMDSDHYKDLAL